MYVTFTGAFGVYRGALRQLFRRLDLDADRSAALALPASRPTSCQLDAVAASRGLLGTAPGWNSSPACSGQERT